MIFVLSKLARKKNSTRISEIMSASPKNAFSQTSAHQGVLEQLMLLATSELSYSEVEQIFFQGRWKFSFAIPSNFHCSKKKVQPHLKILRNEMEEGVCYRRAFVMYQTFIEILQI